MKKIGLRIVLTYKCNKRCSFCYQKDFSGRLLSVNALREIFLTSDFKDTQYITVMGGEVAYIKEFNQYLRLIREFFPNTVLNVTTNGSGDNIWFRDTLSFVDNISVSDADIVTGPFFSTSPDMNKIRLNIFEGVINSAILKNLVKIVPNITVCGDIRKKSKIIPKFKGFRSRKLNSYSTYNYNSHGGFRYFAHTDYDKDNWIILPSGKITEDFNDVINGM